MSKKPYGVIYLVQNLQNKKIYVGQTTSKNPIRYIEYHFTSAKNYFDVNTKHKNGKRLYRAIRKYGKEMFTYRILGECYSEKELDKAEVETIWLYRSFGSDGIHKDDIYGYNLTLGGRGNKGKNNKGKNNPRYYEVLDTTKEIIVKLYKEGQSTYQIAEYCRLHKIRIGHKIIDILKEAGIYKKHRRRENKRKIKFYNINEIIKLAESGYTYKELSTIFGFSDSVIATRCREFGLNKKSKWYNIRRNV